MTDGGDAARDAAALRRFHFPGMGIGRAHRFHHRSGGPSMHSSLARTTLAAALGACAWFSVADAHAHIRLLSPASWVVEAADGTPQKAGPCGGNGTPTGMITEFQAGETIMVQWQETVPHPGHFRISLAENRTDFVDPQVQTAPGSNMSVSATVMDPPVAPVLRDNVAPRTSVSAAGTMFNEPVTLPDTPCEKCTLQVIQFMAEHAPGYFYYHCADIRILAADGSGGGAAGAAGAGAVGTGGTASSGNAGSAGAAGTPDPVVDSDEDDDSGCSIARGVPSHRKGSLASLALLGLGAELVRRRTRR
jgi:BIM1-like copper acquisition factor